MRSFHPDVLSATKGRRSCSAVKGLMISGVPPAADVRGMAVNRDEAFYQKALAGVIDTCNVVGHVLRHGFGCSKETVPRSVI